jgi:NAD(P)-dependent dehydrogenase (short-subunit alcohol dehydrogenase family)
MATGGASGIDLAIAEALLADGWKLILADLAQGPLDTAAPGSRRGPPMPPNASSWTSPTKPDAPFFETGVELFRSASPDEIAVAALFLLDDRKARFAPGHILNVDGRFAAAGYQPDPK